MGAKFIFAEVNERYERNGTFWETSKPMIEREILSKLPLKGCNVAWLEDADEVKWTRIGAEEDSARDAMFPLKVTKQAQHVLTLQPTVELDIDFANGLLVAHGVRIAISKKDMKRLTRMCKLPK